MHYVPTSPVNNSQVVIENCDSENCDSAKSENIFPDKFGNSKSRKEYMREYTKKKRMNNEFGGKDV